jgi:hypothetical protein
VTATRHFIDRVRERMGPQVDPDLLAWRLVRSIRAGDEADVQFVSRVNKDGARLFRFLHGGREFFALVDTDSMTCVSVFPPGFDIGRQEKSRLRLR